ncbi:HpcH/HpaI aldolase/citrate lyase family protein [Kitasatospora sp. NPDC057692]|uniref:HpcH/HpaI aldolase family protein n=1 Tax=Kitasatospora sp. NPDC057692 TaxID=3346215 RepID=UPI0036C5CF94
MKRHPFLDGGRESPSIGLWLGLANPYTAELCATIGFDWVLIDSEHAPNTLRTVVSQLQAIAATPATPVVRPPTSHPEAVKRYLDIGARTLLLPMVDGPEQAAAAVAATRYPPEGTRGVGSALARASLWGQDPDYLSTANSRTFVIAQIESPRAVASIDDITAVDGIDAVFIGLSDLAATMGRLGEPTHPDVLAAFRHVVQRAHRAGKPVGTLAGGEQLAETARAAGCQFIAVGTDVGLLTRGGAQLLGAHRRTGRPVQPAVY